jgi:hypothetical protein
VSMPVLVGKPDLPIQPPLEPTVQGRKYITAQAGDATRLFRRFKKPDISRPYFLFLIPKQAQAAH